MNCIGSQYYAGPVHCTNNYLKHFTAAINNRSSRNMTGDHKRRISDFTNHRVILGETMLAEKLPIVGFLVLKKWKIYNVRPVTFSSQDTSLSNGASYQVMKPWEPRSYDGRSKRPPSISRRTAVYRTAFSQTCPDMLASIVITAV
jgi:hypothetical protein